MTEKLKIVNGAIFVEKYDKVRKSKDVSPFSSLPTNEALGLVRFVDSDLDSKYPIGSKVYFKNKYERLYIGGIEYFVMQDDNIVAVLNEED